MNEPKEDELESTVRPKSGESYPFLCGKCGGAQVMVAVYQRNGALYTALNCAECGNRRESKVGK